MSNNLTIVCLEGRDWWDSNDFPARLMDQHFGVSLIEEDLLAPLTYRGYLLRPRTQQCYNASGLSEVKSEPNIFEISLDVDQFEPEEISVKIIDNFVVVHAKHEEKPDSHGFIAREFKRRYMLPDGVEQEDVKSSLTGAGILKIVAPRKIENQSSRELHVPIVMERPDDKE